MPTLHDMAVKTAEFIEALDEKYGADVKLNVLLIAEVRIEDPEKGEEDYLYELDGPVSDRIARRIAQEGLDVLEYEQEPDDD